jgi:hypothetical protein
MFVGKELHVFLDVKSAVLVHHAHQRWGPAVLSLLVFIKQ